MLYRLLIILLKKIILDRFKTGCTGKDEKGLYTLCDWRSSVTSDFQLSSILTFPENSHGSHFVNNLMGLPTYTQDLKSGRPICRVCSNEQLIKQHTQKKKQFSLISGRPQDAWDTHPAKTNGNRSFRPNIKSFRPNGKVVSFKVICNVFTNY